MVVVGFTPAEMQEQVKVWVIPDTKMFEKFNCRG
jgi:hypothetical protein